MIFHIINPKNTHSVLCGLDSISVNYLWGRDVVTSDTCHACAAVFAPSVNSSVVELPVRGKRGRKTSPDSLVFKTVGLTAEQWFWLALWFPSSSPTSQLRELFNRALKFWPAGPSAFGHPRKSGGAL